MIDLHTHSTHSDGTFTPSELVAAAEAAGLSAIALTDHDTLSGAPEFVTTADGRTVRAIVGVELGARHEPGEMHLLGYGVSVGARPIEELLSQLRRQRKERNRRILERLAQLDRSLSDAEVAEGSNGGLIGRPHIAEALVRRGWVKSPAEAFERLLAKGRPAYEARWHPDPEECIERITASGGVTVLAHPISLQLERAELVAQVRRLRDAGLRGIEAWHPHQSASYRRQMLQLARDHGLVATGGSDFHGTRSPGIRLGVGAGDLRVPDDVLPRLLGG